jgi:hypothetical protein
MNADRSPLFCSMAWAERIGWAEARIIDQAGRAARRRRGDSVEFVIPVAGDMASYAEEGAPLNMLIKYP